MGWRDGVGGQQAVVPVPAPNYAPVTAPAPNHAPVTVPAPNLAPAAYAPITPVQPAPLTAAGKCYYIIIYNAGRCYYII